MEKLDLSRLYKSYYTAKEYPEIVVIEPAQYLSLTGQGDPSETAFASRIEALYSVAYKVKFARKANGNDFTVSKLEGLWWYDESKFPGKTMAGAAVEVPRSAWEYRLMIRIPDFVNEQEVAAAALAVAEKKGISLAPEIALFKMNEGKCVQMLHIGPFAGEQETLEKMFSFIKENEFKKNGLHHEIYLSDFRKTPPQKLKTILREPVI